MDAEEADQVEATAETQQGITALGSPLPGTDPDEFAASLEAFVAVETIEEGIGPTFNETSCGACHNLPVTGGSGVQIERRFGKVANGRFFGYDRAPDNQGGTLRQLFSNDPYQFEGKTCTVPLDREPADATVHNVGRRALPLFGLGLVDALPDSTFDSLAASQPSSIRGRVVRAIPQFPDVRDPTQSLTATRVARFGIKNQQTNLVSFSGDAYINEMGITTQSCYKGTSILAFAFENLPNNRAIPGCNGGDLAPVQPAGNPNVPEFTDDAVGECEAGESEVQDDLAEFLFFMEHMAPPPQNFTDPVVALIGPVLFNIVGCEGCHTPQFQTPARPFNGVPGNFRFSPYSDFLTHDMGSLGDFIGETGDTVARTRQMRTAPLWGARFNTQFLHDGRALTIREAILAHDGQGRTARNIFAALDSSTQTILIRFVNSL